MRKGLLALAALLCALLPYSVSAQAPVAQFSANTTAGCSPIVVQFTDQSTGSPTSWSWDLGNGGSSTLQNPGATYINPGTYTVILTATNSNGSSSDTLQITVYASPTVAFSADTSAGCGSKTVTFTNTTTPGAGGAVNYLWDFGDGNSSTSATPTHTYTSPGTYSVSLIVTNSNGCTKTLTKSNYIKVYQKPTASFTNTNTSLCKPPLSVTFTNTTVNATSYSWDFGDGNTSTATSPTHIYTTAGTYSVTLIATSANGCTDTITKANLVQLTQATANFSSSSPACLDEPVSFTNTTTPSPGSTRTWNFGDGKTDTSLNPSHVYGTAGTYNVTLIEYYANGCSDTVVKAVTVSPKPTANFAAANPVGCTLPFNVTFTNSSTGATNYLWNFGDGDTSTATSPSHSYTSFGTYTVSLTAINSAGCSTTKTQTNYIKVLVPSASLTSNKIGACPGENIVFISNINAPLVATSYTWDFGDGSGTTTCGGCKNITHSYASTGTYTTTVIITTAAGCSDTATRNVTIYSKPTANFTGSPLTICPDATVSFTNSSTGASTYMWYFGDGFTANTTNPGHTYNNTGIYTVSLVANNNGCKDTLTRSSYVTVNLPRADFTPTYECSTRQTYTFLDSSIGANTYLWDFGDGNTSTTAGNVSHTYASPGIYNVELRVTNTATGCIDTLVKTIDISAVSSTSLIANDTTICAGEKLTMYHGFTTGYTYTMHVGNLYTVNTNGSLGVNNMPPGTFTIKLIVQDNEGCIDSVVKTDWIRVGVGNADVSVAPHACKDAPVLFTATYQGGFPITGRFWNFGDGGTATPTTDTVSHTYTNSGAYTVTLILNDSNGCADTVVDTNVIEIHKPTANFTSNDTLICVGDTVQFLNPSAADAATYTWSFGDGNTGTATEPTHVYSTLDTFTVKLNLTDTYGCKDSLTRVDYIKTQGPTAAFTMSDSLGDCPPLTVNFTNTSLNTSSVAWTFGNGSVSANTNPSTTYTYPGVYNVLLTATNVAGCTDTTSKTVTVNGPTGTYTYSPTTGCTPLTVYFSATTTNTTSYIWDFNNGVTQTTTSDTLSYTYTQSGKYVPKLVLSDGSSCLVPIENTDTVTVDVMDIDFSYMAAGTLCNTDTIHFDDTVLVSISDVVSRLWNFGDGTTDTVEDPSHYYNAPGTYTVTLTITNATGCTDSAQKTVTINQLPNVVASTNIDSLCPFQPGAQLTATGAATYTWTPATGLSCTNCPNPIATPISITTYTVTGVDTNGCESSDSVTITINEKPVITVTPDTSICEGSSVQLQASGATTYSWTPGTGLSCTGCPNPVATPITTTVYTVIGTNTVGCTDTAMVTVTVNTKPSVNAGADKAVCPADSTLLVATGATSYLWTPAATLSCDTCDSTYATPATTTTYTVIGSLANGCSDTDDVKVTVNTLPNIDAGNDTTVCVGTTVQLHATGGNTYSWTPGSGLSCTSCPNPMANPTTTTTYTVTGTDTNGCVNSDSVKITINPLPNVNAGADVAICLNDSVQLQATGAATYTWTPTSGLGCTSCPNPKAGPAVTTTYTVTGTDTNGCVNSDSVLVTVKALPNVNAGADKSICTGDSVLLQATGATTYIWAPATTLSCDTCSSTYASPTTNTTYTVVGTLANGCSDTDTVAVIVNTLPNIYAGPDTTVCQGTTVQLQATGGSTYTWTPATGLSCTGCANPMANPTTTTTYTVTGTDTNGCKNTDDVKVNINPLPNVNAGADIALCLNDSVQLQATGASAYTWTPSSGLSCTSCPNPKASPGTVTTYTVTGTDTNGCVNTDNVQVTVKALPTVNAGTDKHLCPGDTAQLQATGAVTYLWSPSSGLSCTSCPDPKASPLFTVTYIVTGTAANGCKGTDTVNVIINSLPTISAGPDRDLCKGDTLQLQATGGVSYVWTPSAGLTCTNCPNPQTGVQVTTTYTVTGTDTNGCVNTDSMTVTVKPLPDITITAGRDSICAGDTTSLFATGATSYAWSPSGGLSCSNCPNPVATPLSTTTYVVTGVLNGCTDTGSFRLYVRLKPVLMVPQNVALCEGASTKLYVTGAQTYNWSPSKGLSCTGCDSPIATPASTTTYTVSGTDSFGCTNTENVKVTVNPLPDVDAGDDVTVCDGDSVQLQAKGGVSFVWSPPNDLSCSACPNPKAGVSENRTYTVTGVDGKGCKNTDDVSITVIKKTPVSYSNDDSICIGENTNIWAEGGTDYKWMPEGSLQSPNSPNTVAAPIVSTNYKVIIKQGECFTDTGEIKITVFPKPTVELGNDQTVSGGTKVILEPDVTNVSRYEWSPTADLSCFDCSNPVLTAMRTTTYMVKVYSEFGCTAEDDVTIHVTCGGEQLFIPNTFTPNGDGLNDRFYPQGRGAIEIKRFSIYNRWGQLLYDRQNMPLNDAVNGWDGTYKSEPLQPDVFVYIIKAVCENGEPIDLKGDISLVR